MGTGLGHNCTIAMEGAAVKAVAILLQLGSNLEVFQAMSTPLRIIHR